MHRKYIEYLLLYIVLNVRCIAIASPQEPCISLAGVEGSFHLYYSSSILSDMSGIEKPDTNLKSFKQYTRIDCQADLVIELRDSNSFLSLLKISSLDYIVNDIKQTALSNRIINELSDPFLTQFNIWDVPVQFRFYKSTTEESRALASSLLQALQFEKVFLNTDSSLTAFLSQEADRTGIYTQTNEIEVTKPGEIILKKRKNSYNIKHQPISFTETVPQQKVTLFGHQLSSWSNSKLLNCKGTDTQEVKFGGRKIARCISTYTFERNSKISREYISIRDSTFPIHLDLPENISEEEAEISGAQAILGSSTTIGLLDSLGKFHSLDSSALRVLPNKLAAALMLYPTFSDSLYQRAILYDISDDRTFILANIFARNGSTKNQERLLAICSRPIGRISQFASFISLYGIIQHPSRQTIALLKSFIQSEMPWMVRSTALLALGSLCPRITDIEITQDSIVKFIKFQKENLGLSAVILALGNSGHSSSMMFLDSIVNNSTIDIRTKALFALRFIENQHVDSLYSQLLLSDSISCVTILNALQFRRPSEVVACSLTKLIQANDPGTERRTHCLSLLAHWLNNDDDEGRPALLRCVNGAILIEKEKELLKLK